MSNIQFNTTLTDTGFGYNRYNTDIKLKSTYGDFTLPAWSIENFDSNSIWKARYNLKANEDYTNLTEEQKELLRKEVFNSWAETIWSIIRQRIGLSVDLISFAKLDKEQQENIRLAIAQQVNNWRINLPYEINNNVSRVSGNLQTTINASAFTTGFDILSQQTKQSITATGLDRYDYTDLLEQCYREDSLLLEVLSNKERITFLEENKIENKLPENLLTRVEAVNTFQVIGNEYLTKTEADNTYLKSVNLSSVTTGGYFQDETKTTDKTTIKRLKNTGSKELKIDTGIDNITYQFLNNNNVERTFTFNRSGFTIDNETLPTTNSILSNVRNIFYDKNEIDIKETTLNQKITSEDNKVKELLRQETTDLYYTKDYINDNYYNKSEVDTKITSAQTNGQVDLSNYYNKNETDTLLTTNHYTKTETDNLYYTKANSDLRLSTISANIVSKTSTSVQEMTANLAAPTVILREAPVKNSNNAARMQDIISEVKRLFTNAITEYDKTAKKQFSFIGFVTSFYELESDDEEIIISVSNQQVMIDAANISTTNLLVYKNTYYEERSDRNVTQTDQLIYLKNVSGGLQFSSQSTSRNIGPAGTGNSGGQVTNIATVVIRKDSVRELIKSLKNVV